VGQAPSRDAGRNDHVRRLLGDGRDIRADVIAVLLLVLGAIAIRAAFFTSAPPFFDTDSPGYYAPGRNLVFGDGFNLGLRRTPTYPLFIAAVVSQVGEDLQALVTVQHFIFGPVLVGLTYLLGRLVTSRLAAIGAAALVGISGPLLLYEHYVMTEVPFAILQLAVLIATVLAVRCSSLIWAGIGGLLLGALVLCRPSGQLLAPIVAGAMLLMPVSWSRRLAAIGLLAACALVVIVPWMAYNQRTQGAFAIAGSGRFLLARTLKNDPGGSTFDPPPGVVEEGVRAAARRIVQEEAARKRPGSVAQRLRVELGLSDAEANPLMHSFALEAIRNRPVYFATSSLSAFVAIMVGEPIDVRREGVPLATADLDRRARAVLRKPTYDLEASRAQGLLSMYDPARYGMLVPALFALGTIVAGLSPGQRWLLLPTISTLALVGGSAALVGDELRYRVPQDPLIALVVCAGTVVLLRPAGTMVRRLWRERRASQAPSPSHM
jgi:hypothetical protein